MTRLCAVTRATGSLYNIKRTKKKQIQKENQKKDVALGRNLGERKSKKNNI